MPDPAATNAPDCCTLVHRMFSVLEYPIFRRAETDGTPVLVIRLGEREAVLPLRSLQSEFGMPDDTSDGRMLVLIAGALDFVSSIRPGDPLPAEIVDGSASWEPGPDHLETAVSKLRQQLVAWVTSPELADATEVPAAASASGACSSAPGDEASFGAWLSDGETDTASLPSGLLRVTHPAEGALIHEALGQAAAAIGVDGPAAVGRLVMTMAGEMAFIEALRARLLHRMKQMAAKIEWLARNSHPEGSPMETLTQVRRLSAIALKEIAARFAAVDERTAEVLRPLRHFDAHCAFLRANRDWLYRTQRAWDPIMDEWDGVTDQYPKALLSRTYRFLAPRFMPVTEWVEKQRAEAERKRSRHMVW